MASLHFTRSSALCGQSRGAVRTALDGQHADVVTERIEAVGTAGRDRVEWQKRRYDGRGVVWICLSPNALCSRLPPPSATRARTQGTEDDSLRTVLATILSSCPRLPRERARAGPARGVVEVGEEQRREREYI